MFPLWCALSHESDSLYAALWHANVLLHTPKETCVSKPKVLVFFLLLNMFMFVGTVYMFLYVIYAFDKRVDEIFQLTREQTPRKMRLKNHNLFFFYCYGCICHDHKRIMLHLFQFAFYVCLLFLLFLCTKNRYPNKWLINFHLVTYCFQHI